MHGLTHANGHQSLTERITFFFFFYSFQTYWIVFISTLVIFTITYGRNWNYHITTVQQQAMVVVTHHNGAVVTSSRSAFLPFHF